MRLRFQVALFMFARLVINTGTRMIYPYLSVFSRGLGVDLATLSFAVTTRASTGLLIPFINSFLNHHPRRNGMILGVALVIPGFLLVTLWQTYLAFFISLSLTFLGYYIFMSSMQSYLGDRLPYERRGFAMGLVETGWALSFIIGVPLVGLLIAQWGWQAPFPVLAFLSIGLLILVLRIIPNVPHHSSGVKHNAWHSLRLVFTNPAALAGLSMSFCFNSANEVVNLVFGVWIESSFGLQIAALGASAAVIGLSDISGELLGGGVVDRLGKERSICLGMGMNALVALALPWLGQSLWGALLGLFLFYFSFEFAFVSALPLISEVMPSERITLMGANVAALSLGRMFGSLVAPLLYVWGFQANAVAALVIDILAVVALSRIKLTK